MGFLKAPVMKAAISLGLLGYLLSTVDLAGLARELSRLSPVHLVAGLGLYFAAHAVNAAKLGLLLPELGFGVLFRNTMIGQFYGLLLPGQLAGDAMKAYRLRLGEGGLPRIAAAVMVDKLTGLAGSLAATLAGLVLVADRYGTALPAITAGLVLAMLAGLQLADSHVPEIVIGRLRRLAFGRPRLGRLVEAAARLVAALRVRTARKTILLFSIGYGIAFQVLSISCAMVLAKGIGIEASFVDWCVVSGVLTVVLLAPVTLAGLGLREATMIGLLGVAGVPAEPAFAAALLLLGAQMTGAVLGAVFDLRSEERGR